MNRNRHLGVIGAGLIMMGSTLSSLANQLPGERVSGRVTAVAGDSSITINGKTYRIKSGTPAAAAARTVTPGQVVDVQLNGPANSSATEVINLVAPNSR